MPAMEDEANEAERCGHPITFRIWLSAVFYYGFFKCKRCGDVIHISDQQDKRCKRNCVIAILFIFSGVFLGTELESKWPNRIGMLIGITYLLIALLYDWKHRSRWYIG